MPARKLPTDVRELFVEVHGSHMIVFDNVYDLTGPISDALCQIATGSGFGRRKLFTDTEQVLIGGSRPVFLTGLQTSRRAPDLADRLVVAQLSPFAPAQRRSEAQLRRAFKQQRPLILGALLDAVVCGLRNLPSIRLAHAPRMIDFATWAMACEAGYAEPGAFLAAFAAMSVEATEDGDRG